MKSSKDPWMQNNRMAIIQTMHKALCEYHNNGTLYGLMSLSR